MSDKDYSGCDNYNKGKCRIPEFRGGYKLTNQKCTDVDNCYYKQLQASQKEVEELKTARQIQATILNIQLQENTALKQQLDINVEALMQTKIISFWAVGYYNKDDATSDVLEKFERIGTVAKTALDKITHTVKQPD